MGDAKRETFYSERKLRKYNQVELYCIMIFQEELARKGETLTLQDTAERWVNEHMPEAFEQAYMQLREGTDDHHALRRMPLRFLQAEDFQAHYDLTKKIHDNAA